jgi:two-component system sensor histidine kinase TctE
MASEPAHVHGDALLLREAIKNLIDNALKHGGAEGPLQVALTVDATHCIVTIADHGPGIAAAEANTVFERFARGQSAPQGGAGLGLAIVKRVADSHGAHIDLSNRPGGGLIVTLRLPRSA